VPHAGQRAWGRLLRSLGGEYADIASLAYAQEGDARRCPPPPPPPPPELGMRDPLARPSQEEQCTQLLDAEGDDDDIHFEQTYEDEEE